MKISDRTWGIVSGAVAAAAYGLNPLFAVPLYSYGLTPPMVLFYRFALAAVMLVPLLTIKRCGFALTRGEFFASLLGGFLMVVSSLCLYTSFKHMDVGLAMTLLFLYPVIVAVIMSTVYHVKLSRSIIVSIVLALGGLALVTLLGKSSTTESLNITWKGVILAIGSSLSYAFYIVAVRKSPMKNLPSEKLTFYTVLLGCPFFLIFLHGGAALELPSAPGAWLYLIGVAFFPTIIALAFMAVAIEKIGATPTAILGVLEPVTGLLVGILLYGEKLTVCSSTGILLIFSAVVLVILADRNSIQSKE